MSSPSNIASAEAAEAAEAAEHRSRTRRMAPAYRQFFGFLFAFALVVGLLAAWAWAQELQQTHPDGRLWGEMAFLGLVVWWGLTVMSSLLARMTRAIHKSLEVPAISTGQALVWAVVTVVAVPVAIQLRWLGLVFPIVSAGFSAGIWLARRRSKRVPRQPLCFSVVVGALALVPLVPIAAWAQPNHPTDLGLSTTSPVPGARALATELRPLLFFDGEEKFEPVKIEGTNAQACKHNVTTPCDPIVWSKLDYAALDDTDYISVTAPALGLGDRPGGRNSAVYYHVFEDEAKLYVDYWWYFAHNPAPVGGGVLCGKALTRGMLGAACAEHPADWEGITLVLVRRRDCNPRPGNGCVALHGKNDSSTTYQLREAHYAQHDKVVWYRWGELQKRWRGLNEHAGNRPLVYVARHSHASYVERCPRPSVKKCRQLALPSVKERRNGDLPWTNNLACGKSCLLPLPTHPSNGAPSKWNAYDGHWGAQHCILLESYCDTQRAPKAPAFQRRYQEPCPVDAGQGILVPAHCASGVDLERIARARLRVGRLAF
jgi:hypothetical protein